MRKSQQRVIFSILILSICYGITMTSDSPCGDWEPYKDEKYFKIFHKVVTEENAEKICSNEENKATLVTIRSKNEQDFLSNLLFKTYKVVDNVWIGAKRASNKFKWVDGSDLSFTNWNDKKPVNQTGYNCVQMSVESSPQGKWTDEPCNKSNLVVCQKMQDWSLSRLQKTLLDSRKELHDVRKELNNTTNRLANTINDLASTKNDLTTTKNQLNNTKNDLASTKNDLTATKNQLNNTKNDLASTKNDLTATKNQLNNTKNDLASTKNHLTATKNHLNNLQRNPVPIGFIYAQLPSQPEQKTLWPTVEWKDVSSDYAGLFFRVLGGGSAAFGEMQNENSPRITLVHVESHHGHISSNETLVPDSWTKWMYTGHDIAQQSRNIRFYTSGGEVRPRNKAVRIWKRTK